MNSIFNKDFWLREWAKDKQSNNYTVHRGYYTADYWNRTAASYDRNKNEINSRRLEKTLELFKRHHLLFPGMKVLDIGCGTGTLAVGLAKEGAHVTAVDFSSGMLDQFQKTLTPDIEDKITLLCKDFHDIILEERGWEKGFDLVIAFMSPGVNTPEAFFKMMRASRQGCAVRGWALKKNHPILVSLWEKIMGTKLEDKPQSILFKVNLLFSMGIFPEITFDTIEWDQDTSTEEEFENCMSFFKKATAKPEAELARIIRPYLDSAAEYGRIKRSHKGLTATMVWQHIRTK
jgi:SAM-dependent methyltransferase